MSTDSVSGLTKMSTPRVEIITRHRKSTAPPPEAGRAAPLEWVRVDEALRTGESTCWLSAPAPKGVHTRPVFAAWTGTVFVVASNANAVKTRYLEQGGRCSIAVGLPGAHVVLEVEPRRMTDRSDLEEAAAAFEAVYEWPTEVVGDQLDAPYAAPTSGGPPFQVYALRPVRGHAFPTDDGFEPTRFLF